MESSEHRIEQPDEDAVALAAERDEDGSDGMSSTGAGNAEPAVDERPSDDDEGPSDDDGVSSAVPAEAETADAEDLAAEAADFEAGTLSDVPKEIRLLEAMLFAATEPVTLDSLVERMPEGADVTGLLQRLSRDYAHRGVNLKCIGGRWSFRTAVDLSSSLRIEKKVPRKLSRAAIETLAILCYHQPVTRGEVEEIRGVAVSKGSFDVLLEAGWIKPVGRRRTPGRPATWGTTQKFLEEFGLPSLDDLPGLDELKASGLLDTRPASTIVGGSITDLEAGIAMPLGSSGDRLSDTPDDEDEDVPPLADSDAPSEDKRAAMNDDAAIDDDGFETMDDDSGAMDDDFETGTDDTETIDEESEALAEEYADEVSEEDETIRG